MKRILVLALMTLVVPMAIGQTTVTVNDAGGADFTTIQAAIASFASGEVNHGASGPFTIDIVAGSGPYDEALTLNSSHASAEDILQDLTIGSDTPGTPILVALQLGLTGGGDGLHIYQETIDVTIHDVVFYPSTTGSVVTDDLVKIDENAANATMNVISLVDVVISDTASPSLAPMVTDKASYVAAIIAGPPFVGASSLVSGDVMLKCWGDAGESNQYVLDNVIIFSGNAGHSARLHNDGSAGESISITDSMFASFLTWNAALEVDNSLGGSVTLAGTDASNFPTSDAVVAYSEGWHGIWASSAAGASSTQSYDNILVYAVNPNTSGHSRGISAGGNSNLDSISNSIVVSNYYVILDAMNAALALDDSTLHIDATNASATPTIFEFSILGGGTGSVAANGCIFSSAAPNGILIDAIPTGGLTITDSAVVRSGPYALTSNVGSGTQTNVITVDPIYANDSNPMASDYLDVLRDDYATAGPGGGALGGGATYVGGVPVELSVFSSN